MSRIAFDHVEKVYSRGVKALDDLRGRSNGPFDHMVWVSVCAR